MAVCDAIYRACPVRVKPTAGPLGLAVPTTTEVAAEDDEMKI
jgi:hypothetical protein